MRSLVRVNLYIGMGAAALSAASVAMEVPFTAIEPQIDGRGDDPVWRASIWRPINVPLIGDLPAADDFSARYKLLWDASRLYLLVEMQDDVLMDRTSDPLKRYWDDDCLEVFVDEDASGGDHLYDFNAFAYHIALDNQAVDIGGKTPDGEPVAMLFNDHVKSAWRRSLHAENGVIWEASVAIYDASYTPGSDNQPVALTTGKEMGFMLAYCDNDTSEQRESFIGSHPIQVKNGDKNLGYKDASVFGRITLVDETAKRAQ